MQTQTRDLEQIILDITALSDALDEAEQRWAPQIARVDPHHRDSAVNLAHYWAIRQFDLRSLQHRLAALGLSSLGRSEAHVQQTLAAIESAARALAGRETRNRVPAVGYTTGSQLLRERTRQLLGPAPLLRETRIMVTLPGAAAEDPQLIADLLARGMDVARINCAHDDPAAWSAMVGEIRRAGARYCRIAMDLAGPKLRTGPLTEGPRVVKLRPRKDALGRVTEPAWCWLTPPDNPAPPPREGIPVLPVDAAWLAHLTPDTTFRIREGRGSKRTFTVVQADECGALARTDHTAYLVTGVEMTTGTGASTELRALPPVEQYLTLSAGDTLILTRDCAPAPVPPQGPPHIGCTLPEVFGSVRRAQPILFDDGKITGRVLDFGADTISVTITEPTAPNSRLRGGKGINLPETLVPVPALTAADRGNLAFIHEHADLVEMSFVRGAGDIADLLGALADLGDTDLDVVVKIETAQGFQNLPEILFEVMRRRRAGVMIARGDLAVECGYERLAELQEEILWLCEAAHLPVIWATEVLDRMARSGRPSRAEITDAAMGVRAECVMLNKGPRVVDAVASLADILHRMSAHTDKQTTLMRSLHSWYRME